MTKTYTRKGGPERAEARRLRDQGYTGAEIAQRLGVGVSTIWRWLAARPPVEAPRDRLRQLIDDVHAAIDDVFRDLLARAEKR